VRRNDYGRQRESFEGPVAVEGLAAPFPGVFIRAPRILESGPGVEVIARWHDQVVGVRQGPLWGLSFHPELSGDGRVHALFLAQTLGFGQRRSDTPQRTTTRSRTDQATTAAQ
jgi:pyridoxal 5'-phosphate synthase pdxT subunit